MGADATPLFSIFGPAASRYLSQDQEYVATGTWARLVFETSGCNEQLLLYKSYACAREGQQAPG